LLLHLVAFDEEVATQFLKGGLRIFEEMIVLQRKVASGQVE
jgi:hypothetical protein